MKCFDRLVSQPIKSTLSSIIDPLHTEQTGPRKTSPPLHEPALYKALSYLELQGTYVSMLFIDYREPIRGVNNNRYVSISVFSV